MAAQPLRRKVYFRTHPRALLALKRIMAELEASPRLRFEGGQLTQEAFANASWLMMEAMGIEALEAAIAPHVRQLDALVSGGGATHEGHPVVPVERLSVAPGSEPGQAEGAGESSAPDGPVRRQAR